MKHQKDSRINAHRISIWEFLALLVILMLSCTGYNNLYLQVVNELKLNGAEISGILFGILLFLCVFASFLYAVIKKVLFGRPIRKIAEAAQRVAGGDFTVQLQPFRKDGKKDEIDVLVEDFNTMVRELSTTETLKTDFIANVSHEIKAPLGVIQSYATAIQDKGLSEEKKSEYAKTIVSATKKLSELITNILRLNKIENQQIFPKSEPYLLDEQLRECVVDFAELWMEKGIEVNGDDIEEVRADYDASLLELVWHNLISNAIKFTNTGGTVTVSLKKKSKCAVVTVRDNGCGMSESTRQHIFDKFYQGDTSHAVEGNGLGLALAKRAVDILGGTISVQSEPGVGSEFTVSLPL